MLTMLIWDTELLLRETPAQTSVNMMTRAVSVVVQALTKMGTVFVMTLTAVRYECL